MACEDGREYYAVSTGFDPGRAGPWVRRNVLDKLPSPADPAWRGRATIRDELADFFAAGDGDVELWAWYAAYDHVVLAQLWGTMPELPRSIPRFTNELRQLWETAGYPSIPDLAADKHHALADARLASSRARRNRADHARRGRWPLRVVIRGRLASPPSFDRAY